MPEKCILEAFGTGVPARKVTVKIVFNDFLNKKFVYTARFLSERFEGLKHFQ